MTSWLLVPCFSLTVVFAPFQGFQEESSTRHQWDPQVCGERDGNPRRPHWHPPQQGSVEQGCEVRTRTHDTLKQKNCFILSLLGADWIAQWMQFNCKCYGLWYLDGFGGNLWYLINEAYIKKKKKRFHVLKCLTGAVVHLLLTLMVCSSCLCRNVPYRLRVRLSRKRNEDEDSPNKLYTLVTYVPVTTCKGEYSDLQFKPITTEAMQKWFNLNTFSLFPTGLQTVNVDEN